MITVIHPNGRLEHPETLTFEEAQGLVKGFIEMHTLYDDQQPRQYCCNEDGVTQGLPINETVTNLINGRLLQPPGGARGVWIILAGRDMFK